MSKKVVYIFGAGATQGEIQYKTDEINILMQALAEGITKKLKAKRRAKQSDYLDDIINVLASEEHIDVEHLITLYEESGTKEHLQIASDLKEAFRAIILEAIQRLKELEDSYKPTLYSALISMHSIPELSETLQGIITLNYDDLSEQAIQNIEGGVNFSIDIDTNHPDIAAVKNGFPYLKLHGSFNWRNSFPISLVPDSSIPTPVEALWIPPGVVKKKDIYPYRLLWGRAKELLNCDVLRIIGCSLNRNDWELVSLLYTTQKLRTDKKQYTIELIDFPSAWDKVSDQYRYLGIKGILDLPEVRDYFLEMYFPKHKGGSSISEDVIQELRENITPKNHNIFEDWLRAQGEKLLSMGVNFKKGRASAFYDFIEKGLS